MPTGVIVAFVNPSTGDPVAARRAAELARATGAALHLQAIVYRPEFAHELFHLDSSLKRARQGLVDEAAAALRSLAEELGVSETTVDARWEGPFDAAALRVIEQAEPLAVVLALRHPPKPSSAEWRLVQAVQAPLLIATDRPWHSPPAITACLDPSHAHDKPAALDRAIVSHAEWLGRAFGAGYRVLHAVGLARWEPGSPISPDRYVAELEQTRSEQIRAMLPESSRETVEIVFAHAPPIEALPAFANARGYDLLIIGSLSRGRLNELLIGGTLRALLPNAPCDLLLVCAPLQQ